MSFTGTGKSHVVKAIYHTAVKLLKGLSEKPDDIHVQVTATTGTAAFNIDGETVHATFNLGNMEKHYISLGEEKINALRIRFEHLDILIIDEISMCGHNMLTYVNGRLNQIKRCGSKDARFGNVAILAVGDFYQLPPVMAQALYREPKSNISYWEKFCVWTLKEIMRQKGDRQFAKTLNRIRTKEKGVPLSAADYHLLRQRIVQSHTIIPNTALYVYATRAKASAFNALHLNALKTESIHIQTMDVRRTKKGQSTMRPATSLSSRNMLPIQLDLAVGARVLLTVNLCTPSGLVNGAMGTVTAIDTDLSNLNQPKSVTIKFDDSRVGRRFPDKLPFCEPPDADGQIKLYVYKEKISVNEIGFVRHQYPLILSWGITIHRTQGMTRDAVMANLDGIFSSGMAYVALSRVTSLEGLFLDSLDDTKMYAPEDITQYYETMPELDISEAFCPLLFETGFTALFHNIQSFQEHGDDFKSNSQMAVPKVIGLSEIFVQNCKDIDVQGFNVYCKPRYRGGVALLVNKDLHHVQIPVPATNCDILAVQIMKPDITICVIYKKPSITNGDLNDDLQILLNSVPTGHIVIGGDFNIDLSNNSGKSPLEILNRLQFKQIVQKYTTTKGTLIDHIYVKNAKKNYRTGIVATHYSYHEAVYYSFDQ